jgi:excisionase family DNA binding protein
MTTTEDETPDALLTISGTARLLGLSRDTVREMVRDGDLPTVRIRTRSRIPIHAVRAYLSRSCIQRNPRAEVEPT